MALQMQQLGGLSLSPITDKGAPKLKADRAAYIVGGKGFFNKLDKYVYPGQFTYWDDEPNHDLIPANKKAYDNMQEFLDKIDALGHKAAKAKGITYVPPARQEWDENGGNEMPAPDVVFGYKKIGTDDVIR